MQLTKRTTTTSHWNKSITTLIVGAFYAQIFDITMTIFLSKVISGVSKEIPKSLEFYDNLEHWYLLALFAWRLMTPFFLGVIRNPLIVSLVLAFLHCHINFGWPAEFRMRVFRYFPYYVAGLLCDPQSIDRIPHPTMFGSMGVFIALYYACVVEESEKYLFLNYTDFGLSLENHIILAFQYGYCTMLVLSVILLIKQIPFPLFPFGHSSSTLAIYVWHWQIARSFQYGVFPYTETHFYDGSPVADLMRKSKHPLIGIILLHIYSYITCLILGSRLMWRMVRHITDPDCRWLFQVVKPTDHHGEEEVVEFTTTTFHDSLVVRNIAGKESPLKLV